MAILRQGYVLQVQCDCGCQRIAKVETARDFQEAWFKLMQLGWKCLARGWTSDAGNEYRSPECK